MTAARRPLRVTVWNEYVHELREESVKRIYPEGMHRPIADGIRRELGGDVTIRVATLDEPEHGLTEEALAQTDVLTWWGHAAHDKVDDAVVERVHARVLDGMGIVVLHSGHYSKIFRRLMGTSCSLRCSALHPNLSHLDRRISHRGFSPPPQVFKYQSRGALPLDFTDSLLDGTEPAHQATALAITRWTSGW